MSWRNRKNGNNESEAGSKEGPGLFSDLFQARPSESDRLSAEGLEIASERLRATLQAANKHLETELYSCVVAVFPRTQGPCSLLLYDPMNGPWKDGVPLRVHTLVTSGPATLLCGLPTCGAAPWLCAKHWYEFRTYGPEVVRRLRKEGRRLAKR